MSDILTVEERIDYDYADRRDYDPSAWHVDKLRSIIDRLAARVAELEAEVKEWEEAIAVADRL